MPAGRRVSVQWASHGGHGDHRRAAFSRTRSPERKRRPVRCAKLQIHREMERVKGIEPSYAAWEAAVLPLNYTRIGLGGFDFRP